jgi:hypothetical protein
MTSATAMVGQPAVPNDAQAYPLMDAKQVGVLRRLGEIANLPHGDYSGMVGPFEGIDFAAAQFQLSYASYALAMAHYHRLPAAPGVFKPLFERIMTKMVRPEIWWSWHDISRGGGYLHIPESEGWHDPVVKDNIMYSAYIQSLALMYNVMFDDDRYAQKGALTFQFKPMAYGPPEGYKFEYDQNSLNDVIYWGMVEQGYLGVACEPYCVFQICNQPPILGFRMHDHLSGGSRAEEVTTGYLKAWADVGGVLDTTGHYQTFKAMHANIVIPSVGVWSDAWQGALMHAWNPEFVKQHYPAQRDKWLTRGSDGAFSVNLESARPPGMESAPAMPIMTYGFGWMAVWAAEVGDAETVEGFLTHADRYMNPTWSDGGAYYYPRNDEMYDENGHLIASHPYQGSVLLAWARLNVPDGLHLFYKNPWGKEHFEEPALTEVSFSLDVYRAVYDKNARALLFDVSRAKSKKTGDIVISRVFGRGNWVLTCDGVQIASGDGSKLVSTENKLRNLTVEQVAETLKLTIGHDEVRSYVIEWIEAKTRSGVL